MPVFDLTIAPQKYAVRPISRAWVDTLKMKIRRCPLACKTIMPVLIDPEKCDDVTDVSEFYITMTIVFYKYQWLIGLSFFVRLRLIQQTFIAFRIV